MQILIVVAIRGMRISSAEEEKGSVAIVFIYRSLGPKRTLKWANVSIETFRERESG